MISKTSRENCSWYKFELRSMFSTYFVELFFFFFFTISHFPYIQMTHGKVFSAKHFWWVNSVIGMLTGLESNYDVFRFKLKSAFYKMGPSLNLDWKHILGFSVFFYFYFYIIYFIFIIYTDHMLGPILASTKSWDLKLIDPSAVG